MHTPMLGLAGEECVDRPLMDQVYLSFYDEDMYLKKRPNTSRDLIMFSSITFVLLSAFGCMFHCSQIFFFVCFIQITLDLCYCQVLFHERKLSESKPTHAFVFCIKVKCVINVEQLHFLLEWNFRYRYQIRNK